MVLTPLHAEPGRSFAPGSLPLENLRQIISARFGFWVSDCCLGQLAARVTERAAATGRSGVEDYMQWLQRDGEDMVPLVESLLNGETSFLRTDAHFKALVDLVVPQWRRQRGAGQRLRIASLGCSSGEEPYSMAMVLHEILTPDELAEVEITGVDVSSRALAAARAALYESHQLRELSPARRQRWFSQQGERWELHPALRSSVRFLQHNLLHPLPFAGLDGLFCRNVLIYFKRHVVAACFAEFHAALRPGGYLFLGHSESAFGFPEYFDPVQVPEGIIYQNKPSSSFFS